MDTVLSIKPTDFKRRLNIIDAMDTPTLNRFIKEENDQGSQNVSTYMIEKYRRIAVPFSTFILMLIGVSLSSKKDNGYKDKQRRKQICEIWNEIKIVVEHNCMKRCLAFNKIIQLLRYVKDHRNHNDQCQRKEKRSEEFFYYVFV